MKLTVIGRYGPFAPAGGATSGYLLCGKQAKIAFEMGAGVFSRLLSHTVPEGLDAVVLSHLHYDHVSDMGVLNYYLEQLARKGALQGKLRVYLPKVDCPAYNAIAAMDYFDLQHVSDGDTVTLSGVTLEFFSVKHPTPCLGFVAREGQSALFYSADTDAFDGLAEGISQCTAALLDGAFLTSQYRAGGPHMSCATCAELCNQTGVKTLVTHLLAVNNEEDYVRESGSSPLCSVVAEGEEYTV